MLNLSLTLFLSPALSSKSQFSWNLAKIPVRHHPLIRTNPPSNWDTHIFSLVSCAYKTCPDSVLNLAQRRWAITSLRYPRAEAGSWVLTRGFGRVRSRCDSARYTQDIMGCLLYKQSLIRRHIRFICSVSAMFVLL